ncbi:transposase [Porcipelethomonas sp.]|uniref:transposase n=1 Tax=Porcipelethomonas sp. TaxID=2981675 RepID=UPI003EF550C3
MPDLPVRKPNRLKNFDYSSDGLYFITVCVKNHENMLWHNVGATIGRPQDVKLSEYGEIVENAIRNIHIHYPNYKIDKYVIMPNHIHLLIWINRDRIGRPMVAPTISTVIQQTKGIVTKQIGFSIWQKSFHDHIIRNEKEYLKISKYIENNPLKWKDDCFFTD